MLQTVAAHAKKIPFSTHKTVWGHLLYNAEMNHGRVSVEDDRDTFELGFD